MRDVSVKMDALYQRMQELHNGAVARDAYVDRKLDTQHQRSDRHRGKLNFLACDWVELVDSELLHLRGENDELKVKVASMAEHLCRCSQSSPALSGAGTAAKPFELEYKSDSSYHLVPIASNCSSCTVPPPPENDKPIPVPPPNSESENIDPNNVVAGVPQEMIVAIGDAFQQNQGRAACRRMVRQARDRMTPFYIPR